MSYFCIRQDRCSDPTEQTLRPHTPDVVPETQRGFRSSRITVDMIFCLRQLQKKCDLCILSLSTSRRHLKPRTGLWQLLRKYGCSEKFTTMIESLHTGMMVNVRNGGEVSDTFAITNGVEQGYVMLPTLLSIFMSVMLEEASRDIQSRQNANRFTVAHFRDKTKTQIYL